MRRFEQLPAQGLEQAGNAIGAVSLGMPMHQGENNPYSQPNFYDDVDTTSNWQARGLCAQTSPDEFFQEKGGTTRFAKKVCVGCEVRPECLKFALDNDERFGVWGGLSERERRKLKKRTV